MAREHRIGGSGQLDIPLDDLLAHPFVKALFAQRHELGVEVEDHGRVGKAPSRAGRAGMKPDDKEGLPGKADCKIRIAWFRADQGIIRPFLPCIVVSERLQTLPYRLLEPEFAQTARFTKDNGQTAKPGPLDALKFNPSFQFAVNFQVIPTMRNVTRSNRPDPASSAGRFCTHAWELCLANERK